MVHPKFQQVFRQQNVCDLAHLAFHDEARDLSMGYRFQQASDPGATVWRLMANDCF